MKNFDNSFLSDNIKLIAGTDEAGRGPLAGPVVAAAVIFSPETFIENVNDSKKLSEKEREELFPIIIEKSLSYGVSIVSNTKIDKINIDDIGAVRVYFDGRPSDDDYFYPNGETITSSIPSRLFKKAGQYNVKLKQLSTGKTFHVGYFIVN